MNTNQLEQGTNTFSIYQLKRGDETLDFRFEPLDSIHRNGLSVDPANYDLIYTAPLASDMSLDDIFTRFNVDRPADFKGHSLSVSDVIVLHQDGQDTAYYVDSIGFQEVPEFFQELTPDAHITGEQIRTPRGSFHVTDMTREQMEAAGYGFHHQSEDGKYLIMGNGTDAYAVSAMPKAAPSLHYIGGGGYLENGKAEVSFFKKEAGTLTLDDLAQIRPKQQAAKYIIAASAIAISSEELDRYHISFLKLGRDISPEAIEDDLWEEAELAMDNMERTEKEMNLSSGRTTTLADKIMEEYLNQQRESAPAQDSPCIGAR